ncbi:MAG: MTH1187 family thiamine-binding protein [Candidatus Scalindua sp.]|nr:MTH1187 family thiamine-binding protein [Candidatus Scalindua sp.]
MLVNFSIVPIGKGSSLSTQIAEVLKIVDESGLNYKLHAMGTLLEGEWDKIFKLIEKCHKSLLGNSDRVLTSITIDDRKGQINRITGKVESVERKLCKKLKKI